MKKLILTSIVAAAAAMNVAAQEYIRIGNDTYEVSKVKSLAYGKSTQQLPDVMASFLGISLFTEALKATGISDSLYTYTDRSYGFVSKEAMADSCEWKNDALCFHVGVEYDNVAYPAVRKQCFTVFAVTDDVLEQKYRVKSLGDLDKLAHTIYDAAYPGDAGVKDRTDRRNALNRFVSYHILPFSVSMQEQLTPADAFGLQNNFNRRKIDISNWYETLMPNSLMKFSWPSGSEEGLYINRRGVQSREDARGVYVRGSKVAGGCLSSALNGRVFCVDDILTYGEQTQKVVLDERIRIEATCLSPDFMQNNRFLEYYAPAAQGPMALSNGAYAVGFKSGSARGFEFDDKTTHVHVRPRVPDYWSYCGDDVMVCGEGYDVKIKLPSLPAGKYEVRIGTTVDFSFGSKLNFFLDDKLASENVDFSTSASAFGVVGLKRIAEMAEAIYPQYVSACEALGKRLEEGEISQAQYEEEIKSAKDKYERMAETYYRFRPDFSKVTKAEGAEGEDVKMVYDYNRDYMDHVRETHYMNGPASYAPGMRYMPLTDSENSFADLGNPIRYIIGTFETDGKSEHTLRIASTQPDGWVLPYMFFSYLELVPSTVYDNPERVEDWW